MSIFAHMSNPRKGFDRLSRFYDLLLRMSSGAAIPRSQTALLPQMPNGKKALIVGGGTGTFLVELIKSGKTEDITYIDISEGMIRQSRKKVDTLNASVKYICGTLEDLKPEERFDMIFTPYFLDLFEEKERVSIMKSIQAHLNPGGYWYVSDFAYPDQNLPGKFYRLAHRILYLFFRTVCGISGQQLPDLKSELMAMNMKLVEEKYFLKRLLWAGLWKR